MGQEDYRDVIECVEIVFYMYIETFGLERDMFHETGDGSEWGIICFR